MKQIGHASLTVDLPDGTKEEYIITLPRLRIDGLWYGSPYIELAETSWISSSSGWLSTVRFLPFTRPSPGRTMVVRLKREKLRWEEQGADIFVPFSRTETIQIEYKGKGYFSGKTHSFKATVTGQNGHQAHVIEGQWHTTSKSTKSSANFTDVTGPKEEVTVSFHPHVHLLWRGCPCSFVLTLPWVLYASVVYS